MNIANGIGMICVAVALIWFAIPADGVSAPFLKSHWIVGQLYVMTAIVIFIMGGTAILGNI